ncbi:MAG TPA: pirin family protein [Tepidisphaeraceae bacterium]|nr:pirin family protein [Tepidisphaeraceae bacterium]
MITLIPSGARHFTDAGWLQTYWHFSFSDYQDPKNMHWGAMRVFNDDIIQPGGGFGMHPHRDMEIVTYVVDGELEHQDHLGNKGVVRPGEVQVMSAGSGITHAEYNHSKENPVHLMQLWIFPRIKNAAPRWEQKRFSPEDRAGKLLPIVSAGNIPGTLAIDQDAAIYVSRLAKGQSVSHESAPGRFGYLFVIDGAVALNGQTLSKGDQARLKDETRLEIVAQGEAEVILLDLP